MIAKKNTDKKYYKILNALESEGFIDYNIGLNDLSEKINSDNIYCSFTDIEHIFAYCHCGPLIRQIEIPYNAKIFTEIYDNIPIYHSNKIIVGLGYKLNSISTIKYFVENGAKISVSRYEIIKWAINYGGKYIYNYLLSKLSPEETKEALAELKACGYLSK